MTDLQIPSAARAGESTKIEAARAMAEVQAAMAIARDYPRSPARSRERMIDACDQMALAERAFYRFPRGKEMLTGPTIQLARELALSWGNILHSVKELDRSDYLGRSEMLAYAWDIEVNTRVELAFIVPHKKDTKKGPVDLEDMRSVYENNANQGARRLREAIYSVLPLWFREEAKERCLATLERGNSNESLQDRKDKAIAAYAGKAITLRQLEDKIGEPEGRWRALDIARLGVVWKSLEAGETTIEMEFPNVFTRAEDVVGPQLGVTGAEAMANAEANAAGVRQAVQPKQWTKPALGVEEVNERGVPVDYLCDLCQAVGEHYQDECPTLGGGNATRE